MFKIVFIFLCITSVAFGGNINDNIIKCAKEFLGTPYDPNPLGEYVERKIIVYDEKVDCMYFVFRCTELALADLDTEKSINIALNLRFKNKGKLDTLGNVMNYSERFDYAEDMVMSKKWGTNITNKIGKVSYIGGTRGYDKFGYIKKSDVNLQAFQNGDIIFFVKDEKKRVVNEVVGHLGFVESSKDGVYFIHASGTKKPETDGKVQKILLHDYLQKTGFIGIMVKRI